jgi:glyoxylase-like metal-dependent hydrolase (beta-lactamase superfamily II)
MSLRLRAMTCGRLTAPLSAFLEGEEGQIQVPVPCYLIEHPSGTVLFDSGLHRDARADPEGRLGALARVYQAAFEPGEEVSARLAGCGVAAEGIDFLVTSHLHFDHTGGHAQIPNARLVVQRREWEAGRDPDGIAANFYDPRDYDLGHDVLSVEGEHDLFGDGSVVCLPTPGHTPGHQSLRVRLPGGDVVLCADACYLRRTLEDLHLPPFAADADEMRASLARLRALQAAGARLFFGHDPEFWAGVAQAPAEIL